MKRTLPSLVSLLSLLLISACGKIADEPAEAAPPVVPVLGQHEVEFPKEVVLDNFNRVLAFSLYPNRSTVSLSLGKSTDARVDLIANLMENESGCPLCQRRVRQLPLDFSVAKGGDWNCERAQTEPYPWSC